MKIQAFLKISVLKKFVDFSGKKETPTQVFSGKIFENTFFYRAIPGAAF